MVNAKAHTLYLSYDGMTDPLGQSQVLPYLKGLSEAGYRITLISFEKPALYAARKDLIASLCSAQQIEWRPLVYHKWPPVLSTLWDVWCLYKLVRTLCQSEKIGLIHCRSYITALVGLRMRRKYGVRFIFDMRGFWADERVEGNLWKLSNPLFRQVYRYFKRAESDFVREADHIVSLTENAQQEIQGWPQQQAPITVIPTCVDLDHFNPARISENDQRQLRESLQLTPDDFVLLYLGSWGTWYLTDSMLELFGRVKVQYPGARLLMLTSDVVSLDHYAYRSDVIVRNVGRAEVPLYISISSAAMCLIKPSFSKKASSATKLGELLAMNKLVLCNSGWGDIDHYARQTNCLQVVTPHQITLELLFPDAPDGRRFADHTLSLQAGVARYVAIYEQLLSAQ